MCAESDWDLGSLDIGSVPLGFELAGPHVQQFLINWVFWCRSIMVSIYFFFAISASLACLWGQTEQPGF